MQRSVIAVAGAMCLSVAIISAQDKSSPATGSGAKVADSVTYTGCLLEGASKGTYTLQSASEKGKKNKENGKLSLVVVPADPKVSLDPQVSHSVEITGTVGTPAPSGGSTSDLPVLTAKKVKWHADFCG
jgi:hypothetical protein